MALVLKDRVQETATANTTVSFTMLGAATGYQSFSSIGNTNTTYYAATDISGNWEAGIGTYSTTGPTLTRTTILSSSNAGSAVTFVGTVTVFVTYPSGKSVNLDASGNVSALGTVASGTWNATTLAVAYGGTGVTTSTGSGNNVLSISPTLVTPLLGTPTSGVATNLTGSPLSTGVTGTLPVANGGTGVTTSTGSGNNVLSTSPTLVTPLLGTPTSGVATNLTGLPLSTGVTGTLPVANGGTGVTTSTGSGNNVLSTSPTLVTPVLGTPSSGNLSSCTADGTNAVGYLVIPQNSQSAAYTLVLADAGKNIYHPGADTTARTWTIPANGSVAFPVGTAITFINDTSGGVITISITTDTLVLAGAGTTGSRTLAANGMATCVKMTSTRWIIGGTGLT